MQTAHNFTRLSQNNSAWEEALHRNRNQALQIICATVFSEWLDMTPYSAFHRVAQHHYYERNSDGKGMTLHQLLPRLRHVSSFYFATHWPINNSLGQYIYFSTIIYSHRIFAEGFVQNPAAKHVGVIRARYKGY